MKSIRIRDWEVRAILNGATQIRRLVKPQPVLLENGVWAKKSSRSTRHLVREIINTETGDSTSEKVSAEDTILELWKCPFGKPGDVLIHKATGLELVTKAVRVERVQEISEADAVDCGCDGYYSPRWNRLGDLNQDVVFPTETFCERWKEDNGPDSWDRNDYVWVGEIERKDVV